jgi:hypothetical protein
MRSSYSTTNAYATGPDTASASTLLRSTLDHVQAQLAPKPQTLGYHPLGFRYVRGRVGHSSVRCLMMDGSTRTHRRLNEQKRRGISVNDPVIIMKYLVEAHSPKLTVAWLRESLVTRWLSETVVVRVWFAGAPSQEARVHWRVRRNAQAHPQRQLCSAVSPKRLLDASPWLQFTGECQRL